MVTDKVSLANDVNVLLCQHYKYTGLYWIYKHNFYKTKNIHKEEI